MMSIEPVDIPLLMRQAAHGDSEAFDKIYSLYYTPVYRYIYLKVQHKQVSEDIAQDVFIKVFQAINRFQTRDTNPLAYFFTVARNAVIDYYRAAARRPHESEQLYEVISTDTSPSPEQGLEQDELASSIIKQVKLLNDDQQMLITLKFFGNMSYKEIAAIMGKTEETVRQIQVRALRQLRAQLETFSPL